jgi:hypothetical protein
LLQHQTKGGTLKKIVLGAVAALLLIAPVAAEAKAFRATVVKRNVATKTVVVAMKSGKLKILHNRRDRVGTVLRINGSRVKAVGKARRVHIKGVVTSRTSKSFTVSASGAVVKVRARGHARVERRRGHRVGQGLNVTANVSANGTITEVASQDTDDVDGAELEGTLVCTPTLGDVTQCAQPSVLKIDIGPVGTPILIPVVFDTTLFPDAVLAPLVGQKVEARVDLAPSTIDPSATVLTLKAIDSAAACQAEDDADEEDGDNNNGGGGDDKVARHDGEENDGCQDDD